MVKLNISGAIPPVFTPVDSDGKLNCSVVPSYMNYLVDRGIKTVLVHGTTGEGVTFSMTERKESLQAWVEAASPYNVQVIAQVGGAPYAEVIELARHAEEIGAAALLTLPELYFKPRNSEQLVTYLEDVSAAAPSLPLLYYHFPMMSDVQVNVPEFFSLATKRIPNFKGMKGNLDVGLQVQGMLQDDQTIFMANHVLAPAVMFGFNSSIATVTNMFPELVNNIINSMQKGDVDKAKIHQMTLNKIVSAIASQGDFVPAMKATMEMVTGIQVGPVRRPLRLLSREAIKRIENSLRELHVDLVKPADDL